MDEPTTGLHFHDVDRLITTLKTLVQRGHSIIVIEHNEQFMRAADYLIDMGPGAAQAGGRIVCQGTLQDLVNCPESITGHYLRGT